MRILSLNAWCGTLFDALAAWLPAAAADVVCLQEVTRTAGVTGWTEFSDADRTLPQRADLFDDVAALLPGHRGTFVASDAGPVTDAAGRRRRQEFGIAAFVAGPTTVTAQRSTFVHGAFTEHDAWATSERPRVAHAMRLVAPAARPVTVVHLHGLRDAAGKGDTPARRRQAQRLGDLVERTRRRGDLGVVCGDLNLLPDSVTFSVLRDLGFTDLVGTADTRTAHYRKPVRHASYLLVSDPAAVRRFEIVEHPEVSDHRALVVDL